MTSVDEGKGGHDDIIYEQPLKVTLFERDVIMSLL